MATSLDVHRCPGRIGGLVPASSVYTPDNKSISAVLSPNFSTGTPNLSITPSDQIRQRRALRVTSRGGCP